MGRIEKVFKNYIAMCEFKSGIILRDRVKVGIERYDSYTNLLEELKIADTKENALHEFVRVQLSPENYGWYTNPREWKFKVNQDQVPDWFTEDTGKYEKMMRDAVLEWWEEHVHVNEQIETLASGCHSLKNCTVGKLCGDVVVYLSDSKVNEMVDTSRVINMDGWSSIAWLKDYSTVNYMGDRTSVTWMKDQSSIGTMGGQSTVLMMMDNAKIGKILDGARVSDIDDRSRVGEIRDYAMAINKYKDEIYMSPYSYTKIVRKEDEIDT